MPTPELFAGKAPDLRSRDSTKPEPDLREPSHPMWPQLVTRIVVSMEGRIYREGLVALLSTSADFDVLGATDSCTETIQLCATLRPDVLVMGIHVAWPHDMSALSAIRLASPKTQVLALAPHGTERCLQLNPPHMPLFGVSQQVLAGRSTCLQEALSRGALAAVHGDADPDTLFEAVRAVARGERDASIANSPVISGDRILSPQEMKVARLVGQGASNKEIATALSISDLTAKKHVGNILKKLGLHDRLQLGVCVARNPMSFGGADTNG